MEQYESILDTIKPTDPVFRTVDSPTGPEDFTNHSGGAYGADTLGDIVGREFGFNNHFHYRPYDNPNMSASLRKAGVRSHLLTRAETDHGRSSINRLLNKQYKDNISGNLQGRNYFQVTNASSVYCFGKMLTSGSIKGGTNTAFQLAIAQNKPLYLYDVEVHEWYQYNYITRQLESIGDTTPILTKDYSIVGTRDIEDYHVKDRLTGQWGSRPQFLGAQTARIVREAMRDLYQSTLNALA